MDRGEALRRREAQVCRLAMVYALADGLGVVDAVHFRRAIAFWDHCQRSAEFVLGERTADPDAEKILDGLRSNPDGLTREQIRRHVFRGHGSASERKTLLGRMIKAGLVVEVRIETAGRPAYVYRLAPKGQREKREKREKNTTP